MLVSYPPNLEGAAAPATALATSSWPRSGCEMVSRPTFVTELPRRPEMSRWAHVWTSNTSPPCSLLLSTESLTTARQLRGATTHGEVREVKLGGFSAPTQDVSGASGAPRNDTITAWAQGD